MVFGRRSTVSLMDFWGELRPRPGLHVHLPQTG
jgi:hypothetical protein